MADPYDIAKRSMQGGFIYNAPRPIPFIDRTPEYKAPSLPSNIVDEFRKGLKSQVDIAADKRFLPNADSFIGVESSPAKRQEMADQAALRDKNLTNAYLNTGLRQDDAVMAPLQEKPQTIPITSTATETAEPTKKKGLTQDQMKSRIEASAYANADPNKWGLNGKMPQGWGAVKKSNGEVVVTPPSESNFWGDPEAEKAWRAAEANRKMGLWSMEKTMDPTASLRERQLAADIYMYNGGGTGGASGLRGQLTPKDIHNNQLALNKEQRARYDNFKTFANDFLTREVPKSFQEIDEDGNKLERHNPLHPYLMQALYSDQDLLNYFMANQIVDPVAADALFANWMATKGQAIQSAYNTTKSREKLSSMLYEDRNPPFFNPWSDRKGFFLKKPNGESVLWEDYHNLPAGAKAYVDSLNAENNKKLGLKEGK